jgi:hypothetical protein
MEGIMKPNLKFNLDVNDIEIIEQALFDAQLKSDNEGKKEIQNLRAKLHHQKTWYRPKNAIYVGG